MNASGPAPLSRRYLDLLKRSLLDLLHDGTEFIEVEPGRLSSAAIHLLTPAGTRLMRPRAVDPSARMEGRDWPVRGQTMIGMRRLDHLEHCVRQVLADEVPGDLIEAGVWRGGASIFLRACLEALGDQNRRVFVADSFQGLPQPDPERYSADAGDLHHAMPQLRVSEEEVRANFERYGLLDDRVRFLKGWFHETLPTAPMERLALMRLDGDMYGSTIESLRALYPKLAPGGFVVIDDFGYIEACRRAVLDFRESEGIDEPITSIDWTGVYWRRARSPG